MLSAVANAARNNADAVGCSSISSPFHAVICKGINDDDDEDPPLVSISQLSNPKTVVEADEVIAREMKALSIQDQQRVYEDVNGLTRPNEETEPFLRAKLDDMDISIGLIRHKSAYNLAMEQSPAYVKDEDLRLRFIRCTLYDSKSAARRFVKFFQRKLELFGEEMLTEDITMTHLEPDALMYVTSGNMQIMAERDTAGRFIGCNFKDSSEMFSSSYGPAQAMFYAAVAIVRRKTSPNDENNVTLHAADEHDIFCADKWEHDDGNLAMGT